MVAERRKDNNDSVKQVIEGIDILKDNISEIKMDIAVINSKIDHMKEDADRRTKQLEILQTDFTKLNQSVLTFKTNFDDHIIKEVKILEQLKYEAFPESDLGQHKNIHLDMNKRADDIKTIKRDTISYIFKGIIWAIVVGIFYASMDSIKKWMMK